MDACADKWMPKKLCVSSRRLGRAAFVFASIAATVRYFCACQRTLRFAANHGSNGACRPPRRVLEMGWKSFDVMPRERACSATSEQAGRNMEYEVGGSALCCCFWVLLVRG
ncbi:hypothetical protein BKA81DRAFT_381024 [Phyllosticta paracitricarpa]